MRPTRIAAFASAVVAVAAGVVVPPGGPARASAIVTTSVVSRYVMIRTPVATTASLASSQSVPVTLQAQTSSGSTVAGATVYLSLDAPSKATATAQGNGRAPLGLTSSPQAFVTNSSGIVNISYTTPASLPLHATDTITAQNAASSPSITQVDTYTYDKISSLAWDTGAPGATVQINTGSHTLHVTPASTRDVYLAINPNGTPVGTAVAQTSSTSPPVTLTATFKKVTSSATGTILLTYTQSATTTTSAVDNIVAREDPASGPPAPQAIAQHVYSSSSPQPVTKVVFSQSPIAKAASINDGGTSPTFNAQTLDTLGNPDGRQPQVACIALHTPAGGTTSDATATANGSPLAVCPATTAVSSDLFGNIQFTFTAASSAAHGGDTGLDSVKVGNPIPCTPPTATMCISSTASATDYYDYTAVASYTGAPSTAPDIAPDGSLTGSNTSTSFTVTATAADGSTPVPHTPVYVTFSQVANGGSLVAGTSTVAPGSQTSVETDGNGQVSITYSAPTSNVPTGGRDLILLASDPSPTTGTVTSTLWYDFSAIDGYTVLPTPIAPDGSVAPSSSPGQVNVYPQADGGAADGTVYLAFIPTTGGGSATATGNDPTSGLPSTITLTSTPQPLSTVGQAIAVTYTGPASIPDSGTVDALQIEDSPTNQAATANDTYLFPAVDGYSVTSPTVNPTPAAGTIANPGTLQAGDTREVDLQTMDAGSSQGGYHQVKVAFHPAGAGDEAASAAVGTQQLTTTPQTFVTDATGKLPMMFDMPAVLPNGGTDVITVTQANGTASAVDTYSYAIPNSYSFSSTPIAPAGSLIASQGVDLQLQAFDASNQPLTGVRRIYVSMSPTQGGGSASIQGTTIDTSGNQSFLTGSGGFLTVHYSAPATLPRAGGTDYLYANDTPNGVPGAASGFTSYNFVRRHGYWLVASDGGIFPFGPDAAGYGSTGGMRLNKPIVGMAATPTDRGYWLVASDGGVFPFGPDAAGYGSTGNIRLNQPIVGMAATPTGHGYWLVASDGGIFPFGDARGFGSTGGIHLNKPIVGMAVTPDGGGYWLVASDGGIFPFGNAGGYGSTGGIRLNQPIVGMAPTATGHGYWLVASDGGIFPFGDAVGYGSTGAVRLNQPIVAMATTATGDGYWLVAADGGIFPFGNAAGYGSTGNIRLNQPIVGAASAG